MWRTLTHRRLRVARELRDGAQAGEGHAGLAVADVQAANGVDGPVAVPERIKPTAHESMTGRRNDGNNVDIDSEMLELADTNACFQRTHSDHGVQADGPEMSSTAAASATGALPSPSPVRERGGESTSMMRTGSTASRSRRAPARTWQPCIFTEPTVKHGGEEHAN